MIAFRLKSCIVIVFKFRVYMWYIFHYQKISHQIKLDGALFYADPADLKETDKFLRSQNISRKKET